MRDFFSLSPVVEPGAYRPLSPPQALRGPALAGPLVPWVAEEKEDVLPPSVEVTSSYGSRKQD